MINRVLFFLVVISILMMSGGCKKNETSEDVVIDGKIESTGKVVILKRDELRIEGDYILWEPDRIKMNPINYTYFFKADHFTEKAGKLSNIKHDLNVLILEGSLIEKEEKTSVDGKTTLFKYDAEIIEIIPETSEL